MILFLTLKAKWLEAKYLFFLILLTNTIYIYIYIYVSGDMHKIANYLGTFLYLWLFQPTSIHEPLPAYIYKCNLCNYVYVCTYLFGKTPLPPSPTKTYFSSCTLRISSYPAEVFHRGTYRIPFILYKVNDYKEVYPILSLPSTPPEPFDVPFPNPLQV